MEFSLAFLCLMILMCHTYGFCWTGNPAISSIGNWVLQIIKISQLFPLCLINCTEDLAEIYFSSDLNNLFSLSDTFFDLKYLLLFAKFYSLMYHIFLLVIANFPIDILIIFLNFSWLVKKVNWKKNTFLIWF